MIKIKYGRWVRFFIKISFGLTLPGSATPAASKLTGFLISFLIDTICREKSASIRLYGHKLYLLYA
jgi:hypothetical protein